MATPIKDMEAAFWAYLASKPAYTALGLIEWRGYDGRLIPYDPQAGLFPTGTTPALVSQQTALGSERITESHWIDACVLELALIYATAGTDGNRDAIEGSWNTIASILSTWEAQTGAIGGGITAIAWETDNPKPVVHKDRPGVAMFWVWPFKVTLRGAERLGLG